MKLVEKFCYRLVLNLLTMFLFMMLNSALAADWTTVNSGVTVHLYDVWGISSSEVYAVGENKTILFFDGSSWTQMDAGDAVVTDLLTIWGTSRTDIYAGGEGGILMHYDGTEWTEIDPGINREWRGIWGSGENNIFFGGTSSSLMHYSGGTFTEEITGSAAYYDLWGTAGNNVYAVGQLGTISHYNGSSWSQMESGLTGHVIAGIWGSSAADIFAVASLGNILHCNGGATWTVMDTTGSYRYSDVWGTSGTNVYAVGNSGAVMHYNGTEWQLVKSAAEDLNGVWVSPDGVVFVVGQNGTILQDGESSSEPPVTSGTYEQGYEDGYADGLATCAGDYPYTPVDLDIENPDAYLVLTNEAPYLLMSGTCTHLYGSSGENNIILKPNSGARVYNFIGNNTITIESDFSLFTVSKSGSTVTFEGTDNTVLVIAATTTAQTIVFNDQTLELVIASGNVMLGGTIIQ